MSLETLLEAARYVEQQELRAKHLQSLLPRPLPSPPGAVVSVAAPLKIVSPVALPQLSASPPAALVAVPQVPQVPQSQPVGLGGRSLVAPVPGHTAALVVAPRPPGGTTTQGNPQGMIATATQPVVELITKPLPLLNGFDKPTLIIPTDIPTSPPAVTLHQPDSSLIPTKHFPPPPVAPTTAPAHSTTPTPHAPKRHIPHHSPHSGNAVVSSTTTSNGGAIVAHAHGPSVMRSGTREVHNKLEKNRRAHLKECFEMLKKQLPPQQDEKKSSNLSILHSALRHIQALKKRERENEHEMERLAREKIAAQQKLASLKKELGSQWDNIDFSCLLPENGGSGVVHQTLGSTSSVGSPPTLVLKDESVSPDSGPRAIQPSTPLSVLPHYHPVPQGLAVVGLHKLALVGNVAKGVQMVPSQGVHIITAPQQLNGKVVPLVNAQYLMKPVVVVSTPSAGATTLSPRPS